MSFACRPQVGAFFVPPTIPLGSSYTASGTTTEVSISFNFKTDGTLTVTKLENGVTSTLLSTTWYSMTVTGIGSSYWVYTEMTGGTNPSAPKFPPTVNGAWYQINSDREFKWFKTSAGNSNSILEFKIASNYSGTQVVATVNNVTADVTYT